MWVQVLTFLFTKKDIHKIYGLDPSEELCEMARKTAENNQLKIDFLINGAEEIELPSNSIDTVLITYTLCTIPNPNDALKEIKRVMRSDARIFFVNTALLQIKILLNGKIE